jgi:hypothetical protein
MKQGKFVYEGGRTSFFKDGQLHRDDDLPSVIWRDGSKFWYQNGLSHRLNGPSDIYASGNKGYYINGKNLTPEEHANHPEVKKYRLQQILNRVVKEE